MPTPCVLCLSGWKEAEGTHPPSMYVKDPIFQAARDKTMVLIGLVQWWRLQSSGRRMDRFAFGTCCQWTQCSCRNENKKERPAGSGFLIGTILLLALQPSWALFGPLGLGCERWSLSQLQTGLSGPVWIPAGILKELGAVTVRAALGNWSATCK